MAKAKFPVIAAAALASLIAGPAFITAFPLIEFYRSLPAPIEIDGADILSLLQIMPTFALIGALIAFIPNLVGTLVMSRWSYRSWLARTPLAWIVAGGISGGAIGYLLTGGDTILGLTPAFVVTGGLCAGMCRLLVDLGRTRAT